jgi:hypothetical protein
MNKVFVVLVSTFFAVLASIVLLYISISSGIGPWISPVIILATAALMRLFGQFSPEAGRYLAGIQALGASTGLIAVAVAFTFPAYFFINKNHFVSLLQPLTLQNIAPIVGFVFLWGVVGVLVGHFFAQKLLENKNLKVPVAELVKTTIHASHEKNEFLSLLRGGLYGTGLCLARFGADFIAQTTSFMPFLRIGAGFVSGLITPTIWAVGFIAGHAMAIGLLIGICLKYFLFTPIYQFYFIHKFQAISPEQYFVAISSGLVLADLVAGAVQFFWGSIPKIKEFFVGESTIDLKEEVFTALGRLFGNARVEYLLAAVSLAAAGLWLYSITNPLLIIFLLCAMFIAVYQMTLMAGHIGLVQFGRFATFVMLPSLVFFKVSAFQAVLISAAVCIVGAVAGSMLFQYRLADDLKMKRSVMYWINVCAVLLASTFVVGGFFLLCSHLQLGSAEFFGFRGYARALLIQSFDFDIYSLLLGIFAGIVLRFFDTSPAMVLGGLLMPKELVFAFLVGAGISYVLGKDRKYMPIASGVFAAEAIWIFVSILRRLV